MRRTTILAASTLAASILLTGCERPKPMPLPDRNPSPGAPTTNRETQPQPVEFRFPDCGDGTPPCVTYDDGPQGNGMYLVTGDRPYKSILMPVCDAEDYPTNLPCVWKHPDAKTGEWITLRKPV